MTGQPEKEQKMTNEEKWHKDIFDTIAINGMSFETLYQAFKSRLKSEGVLNVWVDEEGVI